MFGGVLGTWCVSVSALLSPFSMERVLERFRRRLFLTRYLSIGVSIIHGYILLTKTGIHFCLETPNLNSDKPKFLDKDNSDQRTGLPCLIRPLPGRQCNDRISTTAMRHTCAMFGCRIPAGWRYCRVPVINQKLKYDLFLYIIIISFHVYIGSTFE